MSDSEVLTRARARVGSVLRDKYRIDRVLGVGGMAVVYAATHRNQQELAIKMLHPELSIRDDIKTRFLREGYVGNSVKHKGAVVVLDDDVAEDGAAFLVMELLDGAGVEQVWDKHGNRLPVPVVLAIAHQLLDVLVAAHAKQIVHRDIKPANLFLTREGVVKVLDFGIARLRDATSESATQTGMLLGTPAFMAPEQALAQSSKIDGLSDVWAAGATMFSLLTGETVHVGENAQQLMVQAATRPCRSLAAVSTEVSPRVVALVDRALAFDKRARWRSAAEMRDAVRDAYLAECSTNISSTPLLALFDEADSRVASTLSSGAVPAPRPVTRAATRSVPPVASTLPMTLATPPAMSAPRLQFVGGTTAQPVSNERAPRVRVIVPRTSAGRTVGVVAAAIAVLALGGGALVMKLGGSPTSAVAGASAIVSAAPPVTMTAPPSPAAASSATSPALSSAPPTTSASSTNSAKRPLGAFRPGTTPPASPPKGAASLPTAAAPPVPAPTPSCQTVSYFDDDGNKHYRQEHCP